MTLIEFTKDTAKRKSGDRLRVDDASARSFVDIKKVAKRIDEAAEAAEAAAAAEAPEPAADEPESEGSDETSEDEDDESESEPPASGAFV